MDTLSTADVAKLLDVSEQTVRRLIDSEQLPAIRVSDGGWRRVYRTDLEQYAERRGIRLDWTLIEQ